MVLIELTAQKVKGVILCYFTILLENDTPSPKSSNSLFILRIRFSNYTPNFVKFKMINFLNFLISFFKINLQRSLFPPLIIIEISFSLKVD